jgi:hypothetical protein
VSALQSSSELASTFTIRATAAAEVTGEALLDIIDEELAQIARVGPGDAEMLRAGAYWAERDLFGLETALQRATTLAVPMGLPHAPGSVGWLDKRRANVTATGIKNAVARYLSRGSRAAEVFVRHARGAPASGVVLKKEER